MVTRPDIDEASVAIDRLGDGSEVVRDVVQTGRPTVVTDRGARVAVIVDAATYDAMQADAATHDLLRELREAIADADAGRVVRQDAVVQELRERYAGRVPHVVVQELDEA